MIKINDLFGSLELDWEKDSTNFWQSKTIYYEIPDSEKPGPTVNAAYYEDNLVEGNKVQHTSARTGVIERIYDDSKKKRVLVKWLSGSRSWVAAEDLKVID
jgi:hypothetical protein